MFVSQIFDEASEILGTTDQNKVFRKLTQAAQALMESGHWFHTQSEVDVCTGWDGVTLTLPRGIEVPLGVNIDGSPLYFRGRLFQYHVNKGGMYNTVSWAWDDRGFVATQMDIRQPAQVIAVAETDADIGATLRLVGTDQNNRDLRSQMPDGTGVDGLIIQVHSLSDFQRGTIVPDGNTIVTREAAISPFNEFVSQTPHQLSSGQGAILSQVSGTVPTGLTESDQYWVGVVNPTTIQLYRDPLYAQQGEYPIALTSIAGAGVLALTDSRLANPVTSVVIGSPFPVTIAQGNEVTFTGSVLPNPLVAGVTYFANLIDGTNLQLFTSLANAQSGTNPIYLTGSNATFNIQVRKTIAPITNLKFTVPHYYSTGDEVQAYSNGGTLPQPLIEAQNYFVYVIDAYTVTVHTSYTDSLTGNNPIILLTSGSGSNSLNKLIPATAVLGTTRNIAASNVGIQSATGSGATVSAVVTGPVTNITISNAGTGYTSVPNVVFESTGGTGYSTSPSVYVQDPTGSGAAITATVSGGKITGLTVVSGGSGYTASPTIVFSGGGGHGAAAICAVSGGVITGATLQAVGGGATAYAQVGTVSGSSEYQTVIAVILQSPGSGYQFPPRITFTGGGGSAAAAAATITTSFVSGYIITNQGSGYVFPPAIALTGGGGTGASATAIVENGLLTAVNVVAQGTNYSSAPTVSVVSSTGAFVTFSSTGTLPSPLVQGETYRAEAPFSSTGFTVLNADFSTVNITNLGNGTFYAVISRAFSVEFTNQWTGDFSGVPTGTGIYFGTDYLLPITAPAIDNGATKFYVRRLTNSTAMIFDTQAHAESTATSGAIQSVTIINKGSLYLGGGYTATINTTTGSGAVLQVNTYETPPPDLNGWVASITVVSAGSGYLITDTVTISPPNGGAGGGFQATAALVVGATNVGLIQVQAFGAGQSYFAIQQSTVPAIYNNLVDVDSLQYLNDGETVQFSSTGALPAPLAAATDYTIKIVGSNIQIYSGGTLVSFTTLPSGQMSLLVIRKFSPVAPDSVSLENAIFETGTPVIPRPSPNDILDPNLTAGIEYFVRLIDAGTIELYDTEAHARAIPGIVGRIPFTTIGDTPTSTFFLDAVEPPTFVKVISHIEKPITQGYVSLYAYDYGRSNDMTLIGQYHPTEVNPKYRRIRVGKSCAWARILYRVKHPNITSLFDYLPVEQPRAIIAAVHAIDLEEKDFVEQAQRYWQVAFGYLRNQQTSMDGHAMEAIQVDGLTYGDRTDPVMF